MLKKFIFIIIPLLFISCSKYSDMEYKQNMIDRFQSCSMVYYFSPVSIYNDTVVYQYKDEHNRVSSYKLIYNQKTGEIIID